MEASQQGGQPPEGQEPEAPTGPDAAGEPAAGEPQAPPPAGTTPEGQPPAGGEAPVAADAANRQELSEEERNPAADQAPVATDRQDAVVGDPGLREEQQPVTNEGSGASANTPTRTSAPPPEAQSGVPLPEDRAAGVEPGEVPPPPDAPPVAGTPGQEPSQEGEAAE